MDNQTVQEVFTVLHDISKVMKGKAVFGNVSKSEFFVLAMIDEYHHEQKEEEEKGVMVSTLARCVKMSNAATSKLLRTMEGKGYVERVLDDQDRRLVYIRLSSYGKELISQSKQRVFAKTCRVFDQLGERDAAEFLRLTRRLLEILQKEEKEEPLWGLEEIQVEERKSKNL